MGMHTSAAAPGDTSKVRPATNARIMPGKSRAGPSAAMFAPAAVAEQHAAVLEAVLADNQAAVCVLWCGVCVVVAAASWRRAGSRVAPAIPR
jgi:hypothetical protein